MAYPIGTAEYFEDKIEKLEAKIAELQAQIDALKTGA
jgi:uncharacterized protein YceH (UPF0502 family)